MNMKSRLRNVAVKRSHLIHAHCIDVHTQANDFLRFHCAFTIIILVRMRTYGILVVVDAFSLVVCSNRLTI